MKITFENVNPQTVKHANSAYSTDSFRAEKGATSAVALGSSLDDSKTYEGTKKSIKEFKDEIQAIDVETNQKAMAVLSGCMSSEDFGKMLKDGVNPATVTVKDSVTILDRIKLTVAQSGHEVAGFTDTLSKEAIKEMTGLENMPSYAEQYDITLDTNDCKEIAEAVTEAADVTEVTDGIKKYLIVNDSDLTIDNLYLAKHSSMSESKEQGSSYFTIETKGYLAKKGEAVSGEELTKEVAGLLEKIDIEATKENVEAGSWLVENSLPITKENVEKVIAIDTCSLPLTDKEISKAIAIAMAEGKEAKNADITKSESIFEEAVRITKELSEIIDKPFIKATRVLEETRLKMTVQANLMLLKSDYSIDTSDLESYVEALKELEKTTEYKEAVALNEVVETVESVKSQPAAVIGQFVNRISEVNFEEIIESGEKIKARYDMLMETYEAVGTEVRPDLGDSIKKAFRNVPEILNELELPVTKANERAVRILGYNSMEITKDSIREIAEADKKLQDIITRITPADTLKLIREGRSPIDMSVDELNKYLDEEHDAQKEEIEKYSKFLYKLERDNEISKEERKEYIEVYRFFNQIEKTNDAAVGSVLNAGRDLTMPNLKTALKTAKYRGMDVTIGEVVETLSADSQDSLALDYAKERFLEMREALNAPEETVTELVMNNVAVTAENLEAALLLRRQKGEAFKKATSVSGEKAKKKALGFTEALTGREESLDEYESVISECKSSVYDECLQSDSYMDVKALRLVHMQLSVSKAFANCENYEVPVEIGGQVTSVNVKLVHNSKEDPNVVISFETEEYGKVSARLSKENGEVSGYIACNLKDTVSKMQKVADTFSNKVSVVYTKNTDTNLALAKIPMRDNDATDAKDLYEIAKLFLKSVKGQN